MFTNEVNRNGHFYRTTSSSLQLSLLKEWGGGYLWLGTKSCKRKIFIFHFPFLHKNLPYFSILRRKSFLFKDLRRNVNQSKSLDSY